MRISYINYALSHCFCQWCQPLANQGINKMVLTRVATKKGTYSAMVPLEEKPPNCTLVSHWVGPNGKAAMVTDGLTLTKTFNATAIPFHKGNQKWKDILLH